MGSGAETARGHSRPSGTKPKVAARATRECAPARDACLQLLAELEAFVSYELRTLQRQYERGEGGPAGAVPLEARLHVYRECFNRLVAVGELLADPPRFVGCR
jgi:hypothetical protein